MESISEAGFFDSGYGIICRGLLVIDVDEKNGGVDSFAKLCHEIPEISSSGWIVKTGSGGGSRHLFFSGVDESSPLMTNVSKFPGIDFRSGSSFVVGSGSKHKSGNNYVTVFGGPSDIESPPQALLDMLRKPERHRAEYDGRSIDVSHGDIADMLAHISPDVDYDTWIRIGMAVHHGTGGSGFSVWDDWSGRGEKYDAKNMDSHWHSFGRSANPVTLGTLIHHAEQGGWQWPVDLGDMEANADWLDNPMPKDAPKDFGGLPCDVSGVDIKRPPGFTGKVAAYIGSLPRFPRDHIAVGAALYALGCVYSLHYTSTSRAVPNLLVFSVAGSRTGKESIEQGVIDVIRAAGMSDALAGKFKSEQEIVNNLVRNQASFHVIDEIGLELQKLKNAMQRGGTPYLEGVVSMVMSAFGKANGILPLTGDKKEEIRQAIIKRIAQLNKQADEGKQVSHLVAEAEQSLGRIKEGLPRPILAVYGGTTPVTFDDLLDFQNGTNGFIGRSLIFTEHETVPTPRIGHITPSMPEDVRQTILMLSTGGHSHEKSRIEHYGPRTVIPDTKEAAELLRDVALWFHSRAVSEKSSSGLESLYLGAYELVEKVSLILAVPEGVRTYEDVRWAFRRVQVDCEMKIRSITSNDRAKDSPALALAARILNLCSGTDGETEGVIINRCRGKKKDDILGVIAKLVEQGRLRKEVSTGRGRPSVRYFESASA